MAKGNWMYGDNIGKEEDMSKVKADGVLEFTRENTIGDPYVSEPRLVRSPWWVLKSIFKWYLILCGITINIVQFIMWVR